MSPGDGAEDVQPSCNPASNDTSALGVLLGHLSHVVWVEVCPEQISRSAAAAAEIKFVKTNFPSVLWEVE